LAVANVLTNDASILLGHGDGTFNGAREYAFTPTWSAGSIATGDLNHDGNLDVVVQGPSVLLGNGDGTLQAATFVPVSNATQGIALADFNNDGNLDVAVPTGINSGTGNQLVAVMLGNGDGTFQAEKDFGSHLLGPEYLVAGDFNGDGNLDLATFSGIDNSIALGDGTGNFPTAHPFGLGACCPPAAADFNGDGKLDFVASDGASLQLFLGNGDGTFQWSKLPYTFTSVTGVVTADFNGDGIPDIVVVNSVVSGWVSVLLGNGDGTFASPVNYSVGDFPYAVAVGDLNQDGHTDLVVVLRSGLVAVLLGNGDGTFQPALNFGSAFSAGTNGGGYPAIAIADLNGDGLPDVLVANIFSNGNHFGTVTVLLNQGGSQKNATTVGLSSSLNPAASGQAIMLTATASSSNGGLAAPTGTVTFLDGSTTLGTATLSSGAAGLTVSTLSAGSHNLTAVYSGDTHFAGNTSLALVQVVNANAFTVTASGNGSASINPGQAAQYQLALTSGTAMSQSVSMSCSGAPTGATCKVTPASLTLGGTSSTNVLVTVQTTGLSSALAIPSPPKGSWQMSSVAEWQGATLGMLVAGVLLGGASRKRRRGGLGLLLGVLVFLVACGGNGGGGSTGGGTPSGNYKIVVTAQSSAGTQQITLLLNVN
jgi:hypothetical protein